MGNARGEIMDQEINDEEKRYPSVDLAYNFVKPSYDWMLSRFEAANSKIQGLLTFSATITAAFPILVKAIFNDVDFSSPWFYGAIIAFIFLVLTGIVGRRLGSIVLVHPEVLYEKYLYYSHWRFQQTIIYWAGKHFNMNNKIIVKKAWCTDIMTIFLLGEILCIAIWIAVQVS
jgi:hypothetical protein